MFDWERMCAALARQRPYWEPDTDHGYHTNTFGFLVGEVLRRASGKPVDVLLRERLTGPLQAEFHYGLAPRLHGRVARMCGRDSTLTTREQWALAFPPTGDEAHDEMIWHCYFNPSGVSGIGVVNTPAWRASVIPSTSGHGTARAVATLYDALLAGEVAGAGVVAEATRIHSDGPDRVLGRPSRFGLGFQLHHDARPLGPSGRGFGHYGYGGSLGFADPEAGVAFAYLTNRPGARWQSPRSQALIDALYASLGRGG
jgi:CubicO group peptidase (beta-lactamase class C family)